MASRGEGLSKKDIQRLLKEAEMESAFEDRHE
jgi:hypothetical protein